MRKNILCLNLLVVSLRIYVVMKVMSLPSKWNIYIYIYGLPRIFAHKVKQELIGKNDSINYDNLTYGDILSTIKKLGINMCNDEKLLKHQLKIKIKS